MAHANILDKTSDIHALVKSAKRIAVLGIKTEAQAGQPAFYVPKYLSDAGLEVIPVPVYFPNVTHILGKPVYRRLVDIPGEVDVVDVFRRPEDLEQHVEDLLAKRPKAVWFQSGIQNDEVAERLAAAGIRVVQDHCLMVEHRMAAGR